MVGSNTAATSMAKHATSRCHDAKRTRVNIRLPTSGISVALPLCALAATAWRLAHSSSRVGETAWPVAARVLRFLSELRAECVRDHRAAAVGHYSHPPGRLLATYARQAGSRPTRQDR